MFQLLKKSKLTIDKAKVRALLFYKFVVRSSFDDDAIVDDRDFVGRNDSRQTMRDQNARSTCSRFVKSILHNLEFLF